MFLYIQTDKDYGWTYTVYTIAETAVALEKEGHVIYEIRNINRESNGQSGKAFGEKTQKKLKL